jgi:zinc ribbon protein
MIIFGFGRKTRKDHGAAFYNDCPNCKNRTFFHYIAIRVWFTLFFIPVIPYKSIHAYVCRVCSWGFPIKTTEERAEALRRVDVTKRWAAKELTDEQYRQALVTASVAPQPGASVSAAPTPGAPSPSAEPGPPPSDAPPSPPPTA